MNIQALWLLAGSNATFLMIEWAVGLRVLRTLAAILAAFALVAARDRLPTLMLTMMWLVLASILAVELLDAGMLPVIRL